MNVKQYLDYRIIGVIGSILLIISEFFTWFSGLTLIQVYIITTAIQIEDSFIYIFPLLCGIICLIGSLLLLYKEEYKINSVIINFVGLGFLLIFFADILPPQISYLSSTGIGFYLSVAGALMILVYLVYLLILKEKNEENK